MFNETQNFVDELPIDESVTYTQFRNPLDPLLLRLSKDFIDEADLSNRIQELFKELYLYVIILSVVYSDT